VAYFIILFSHPDHLPFPPSHRRRCEHEGSCHHRRPVVFCRFASNQERAACTSTSRLTDIGACLDCQQGGLLQFATRRNVRATSWSIAVSSKRRRPSDFYGQKDRPHYSTAQGPPLVACPWACQVKLCVLAYRCLHVTAPSYLADDLFRTSADGNRLHLRSADSPTLVVRPTRRWMLGDRAFPVAAERAWNSLPPAVRDAPSLLSFRSCLKTWLFELTL